MTEDTSKTPLALAVNAGSSSLKAALIRKDHTHVASFVGERLSSDDAVLHYTFENDSSKLDVPNSDHEHVLQRILDLLKQRDYLEDLVVSGHRVVHGGDTFTKSVVVDDKVIEEIESVSHLAPLHNPHNIKGIEAIRKTLPSLPIVAVFDTSFHTSLPPKASTYPIPKKYRKKGIRKYGFHGTSVRYVTRKAMEILPKMKSKENFNLIVCHLGNGASVTAVAGGKSVETSMGFSPLAGLMMGTRTGDIDPTVISFAVNALGLTVDEILNDLNKESGLKAMVDSHDPDMRSILEQADKGDEQARLAVDMFVYRLVQHIASSLVALPSAADAIIFTGGIGEHSPKIRKACAECLRQTILPGFSLDNDKNNNDGNDSDGVLTAEGAFPAGLEIATDEEAMIAQDCFELVSSQN